MEKKQRYHLTGSHIQECQKYELFILHYVIIHVLELLLMYFIFHRLIVPIAKLVTRHVQVCSVHKNIPQSFVIVNVLFVQLLHIYVGPKVIIEQSGSLLMFKRTIVQHRWIQPTTFHPF